jgi:hypothetical protein
LSGSDAQIGYQNTLIKKIRAGKRKQGKLEKKNRGVLKTGKDHGLIFVESLIVAT